MPTYEYLCKTCEHRYERFQRMTEDPDTVCPECGAEVRRVIYPAGVIFKGSGFYVTDSRKSGDTNGSSAPKSDDKPTVEKSETKSEPAASTSTSSEKKEAVAPAA